MDKKKKKKLRRYPWEKWMNSDERTTLRRGRDYDCMTHSMAQQVRMEATRWGLSVSIQIADDGKSLSFEIWED